MGRRTSFVVKFVRGETGACVSASFTQGGDSESPESHSKRFQERTINSRARQVRVARLG